MSAMIVRSDRFSNHGLPIGAVVERTDPPEWFGPDDEGHWYSLGGDGDEVAIDPRDLKEVCEGTEFETRVETDGRVLHRCTTCDRVNRTTRRHQIPGPATASHDKTMQSLFAYARPEGS